jgi:hypothetical protein
MLYRGTGALDCEGCRNYYVVAVVLIGLCEDLYCLILEDLSLPVIKLELNEQAVKRTTRCTKYCKILSSIRTVKEQSCPNSQS